MVKAYYLPGVKLPYIFVDTNQRKLAKEIKEKKSLTVQVSMPENVKDLTGAERIDFLTWFRDRVTRKMGHRKLFSLRYNRWLLAAAIIEFFIVSAMMGNSYAYRARIFNILGIIDMAGDFVFWGMLIYWTATLFRVLNHLFTEPPPTALQVAEATDNAKVVTVRSNKVTEVWEVWKTCFDDREKFLYKKIYAYYGRWHSKSRFTWMLRRLTRRMPLFAKFYGRLIKDRKPGHSPYTYMYPASWRGRRRADFVGAHVSEGLYKYELWRGSK